MDDADRAFATFVEHVAAPESAWRAIVLFGDNTASYKFALGAALLDLVQAGKTHVPLADLAVPYTAHLARHLQGADQSQTCNQQQGDFLKACSEYNRGEVQRDALLKVAVRKGFTYVLDAFHRVHSSNVPLRFFEDDRKGPTKGIILTDTLFRMVEAGHAPNLSTEVESRWQLIEKAWSLKISEHAIAFDEQAGTLFLNAPRRVNLTSCRGALDGYQKGKCFYCFAPISILPGVADLADIDHLIPHMLQAHGMRSDLNGVWNLVLACFSCNRGTGGKFERPTVLRYLERLHTRNEFLIGSHHPLRQTLMAQTGEDPAKRKAFLLKAYHQILINPASVWQAPHEWPAAF